MKTFWMAIALVIVYASAGALTIGRAQEPAPVAVSDVVYDGTYVLMRTVSKVTGNPSSLANRRAQLHSSTERTDGVRMRTMSVNLTNPSSQTIQFVRLAFVFSDPANGEEWFRYKIRSKKKILPGETQKVEIAAVAALGWPPRDNLAYKHVVVTEVGYSDGSVWRSK